MKLRLPFFGQVKTGVDAEDVDVDAKIKEHLGSIDLGDKEKFLDVLGGFLQFNRASLSDEKTISAKILEANKEWVYRNNDVIAQEVSKVEFQLFQMGLKDGQIVFKELEEHPLLDLLDKFNPTTTKADGIYMTQGHRKLTGDAFWLLDKNGSAIENIYILQPDKVELELGDPTSGQLVKGYKYTDIIEGKKIEKTYSPDEIIPFKKPNLKNQFRGYGVVEALADTIDSDNLTNQVQKKFFKNGAIGNFILTTESKVTDTQLKRLNAEFRAALSGIKNAFKVMVLGGGLKPVNLGYSNKDLQFLDLLEWYRDKIMVCFGNDKASLGIIDDVNRASYAEANVSWLSGTVKPDMDSLVNTLNEFLVPKFGDNLILGYKNPVPEDRTDDIKEATELKNAGIIMINEARRLLGYEEVEGGDIFAPSGVVATPGTLEPAGGNDEGNKSLKRKRAHRENKIGMSMVKYLPASLAHLDIKQTLRSRKMFTKFRLNQEFKEAVKPVIRQIAKGKKQETPIQSQFSNQQIESYYQKQMHIVDVLEKRFQETVLGILDKVKTSALHNIESEIKSVKSLNRMAVNKELFDETALKTEAELNLLPLLMQEVTLAGQEAYRLIGSEDIYIPFNVADTVRQNVDKFTQSMLDTDQEILSSIISQGIDDGQSVSEIRNQIEDKFGQYTQTQAERITRTEVLRASTLATEDAFIQSGVVEAKQWLVAPGADELCASYSGKIVKLRGNFYSSNNEFQDGNPPLHPNCRCVLIPVLVSSKAFEPASISERELLQKRIKELEAQIDKRTKAFKELKAHATEQAADDKAYIKALEKHLGVDDE